MIQCSKFVHRTTFKEWSRCPFASAARSPSRSCSCPAPSAPTSRFWGLGKFFGYPAVLDDPPAEVLASFAAPRPAVIALFTLLAVSAGLLAPIAVLLGRRARTPGAGRLITVVGVAAAAVQVAGLLRWPLVVTFVHDPHTFHPL